ncbi:MAG: hypothetical protein Kow0077_07620 [Anaerolineae bacterium]
MTDEELQEQPTPADDDDLETSDVNMPSGEMPDHSADADSDAAEAIADTSAGTEEVAQQDTLPVEQQPPAASGAPTPLPQEVLTQPRHPVHLPSRLLGILLVVIGGILIAPQFTDGYTLAPPATLAVAGAGLALTLLAYWGGNRRQARGALFLSLLLIAFAVVSVVLVVYPETLPATSAWPLYLVGLGVAILATAFLDRRTSTASRGIWLPGAIFIVAGVVALPFTWGIAPADILTSIQQAWPIIVLILAMGLIPATFSRSRQQE